MTAASGCDRQVEEEPVPYDKSVDGPPSIVQTPPRDYGVITDPQTVIKRIERIRDSETDDDGGDTTSGGGDVSGEGEPASDEEVAEVKEAIAKFITAKDEGDEEALLACYDSETTATAKKLTGALKKVQTKAVALAELMEKEFGEDLPAEAKKGIAELKDPPKDMPTPAAMLGDVPTEDLKMTSFGKKIVVEAPNKPKLVFAKSADGWLMGLNQDQKALLDVFTELLVASEKVLDALEAGVKDGSITADNVKAKGDQLMKEMVGPLQPKLTAIMMKVVGGAMPGPEDGGPDDGGGDGVAPEPEDGADGGAAAPKDDADDDGAVEPKPKPKDDAGGDADKKDDDAADGATATGGTAPVAGDDE